MRTTVELYLKNCLTNFLFFAFSELTKDIPRSPDERSVVMLPLFHTFGLSSIYDYLNRGLCFVLIPRFTMKAMLETIQEFKITIVSLVPAIAVQLVKHPVEKYYDLSSIRFMFSGAAALGKDITEKLTEKFGCYVFQGYGMTESSLRTHSNFINAYREGSIGIVMPFCESKVRSFAFLAHDAAVWDTRDSLNYRD